MEVYCIIHVDRIPLNDVTKRWVRVAAGIILGFTLLYLAGANMGIRVFFCAMVLAAYSLAAAAGLFFRSDTTKLRKILALFFVVLAVYQVIRALDGLQRGESYTLFTASSWQTVSFVSVYVHMLVSTMAYLLISREAIDIKLKEAAAKDYLTGIYNRMQFMQLSEKLFSLMIGQQRQVINDTYGHAVGDSVLAHFSRETQAIIRAEDLFGRYGGEEFIIFSPNTTAEDALSMGRKIKSAIETGSADNGLALPKYTVSMGTATMVPQTLADRDKLIKQADQALLQAKRNGRNQEG